MLTAEQTAEIQRLAVEAFEALECEGLARVDFFLLDGGRLRDQRDQHHAGFTTTSMFPQMWAATGVSYAELVDRLIAGRAVSAERPTLRVSSQYPGAGVGLRPG